MEGHEEVAPSLLSTVLPLSYTPSEEVGFIAGQVGLDAGPVSTLRSQD